MNKYKEIIQFLHEMKLSRLKRLQARQGKIGYKSKIDEPIITGAEQKFAMRQGARSAAKFHSGSMLPKGIATRSDVPSSLAIAAQMGADIPEIGAQSAHTETEDKALPGDMRRDEQMRTSFIRSFVPNYLRLHGKKLT